MSPTRLETRNLKPETRNIQGVFMAVACVALSQVLCGRLAAGESQPQVRMLLGGEYWSAATFDRQQEYLEYLARAKPDVIHAGVLGPQMLGTAYSHGEFQAYSSGVFPKDVSTIRDYLARWRPFLSVVHEHGIKVQAISSMTYFWGNHAENTGFFKYYNDLWETDLFGPKPHPNALELIEQDGTGQPVSVPRDELNRYKGCVNNPHWRQLLKTQVKVGIETGFDGFMVQFPYQNGPCACRYCQHRFRSFLARKYAPEVLDRRFGIRDLDAYHFHVNRPQKRIPAHLMREAREFAAISVEDCFDEVFAHYGRRLKPDLIVSMWTHYREFLVEDTETFNSATSRANGPCFRRNRGAGGRPTHGIAAPREAG